ncbi:MAG: ATP-dependent helicase [Deltaproteobacteria bacterium]|nr:ATP-dependent helicase [Deltaproteobacteria bacterium]
MTITDRTSDLRLETRLNKAQFQAATHSGGPLLIVAGAGSGKTRTLVHKVAWLVSCGYPPSSILLLTFTRKAASEMLARCASLVGAKADKVSGGTFHSISNLLLRKRAHHLGYNHNFVILDQSDSESIIGQLRKEQIEGFDFPHFPQKSTILNIISQAVNKDVPIIQLIKKTYPRFVDFSSSIGAIAGRYASYKRENNLMDFDDLLVNFEKLLTQNKSVRDEIASHFTHILVDEYQDTNPIQARITYLLGKDHLNVTAVGDDAQSIYSFRGATFKNIMDFPEIFSGTTIIKLEDNYRSRPEILTIANHLLHQAKIKYDKNLKPTRESNSVRPVLSMTGDLQHEGQELVERILRLRQKGVELKDIAVLFRAGSHSFELEGQLTKHRIPYVKYGGRKFLEMSHIKDFLCFLRLSINPNDELSLKRILGLLPGLGPKWIDKIVAWSKNEENYFRALMNAPCPTKTKNMMHELADLTQALSEPLPPSEKASLVYNFYSSIIQDIHPDDHLSRIADIEELVAMVEATDSIENFVNALALDPPNNLNKTGDDPCKQSQALTLSTVHSAKGLEWDYVFIISAVDGRFPSIYNLNTPEETEEELRLMYVAVTRAKEELVITIPLASQFGPDDDPTASRFLFGLNRDQVAVLKDGEQVGAGALMTAGMKSVDPNYFGAPPKPLTFDSGPPTRPAGPPRPKATKLSQLALGQRIKHPIFGTGKVIKVVQDLAIIDFDHFGRKNVTIQYSNLVLLDR